MCVCTASKPLPSVTSGCSSYKLYTLMILAKIQRARPLQGTTVFSLFLFTWPNILMKEMRFQGYVNVCLCSFPLANETPHRHGSLQSAPSVDKSLKCSDTFSVTTATLLSPCSKSTGKRRRRFVRVGVRMHVRRVDGPANLRHLQTHSLDMALHPQRLGLQLLHLPEASSASRPPSRLTKLPPTQSGCELRQHPPPRPSLPGLYKLVVFRIPAGECQTVCGRPILGKMIFQHDPASVRVLFHQVESDSNWMVKAWATAGTIILRTRLRVAGRLIEDRPA